MSPHCMHAGANGGKKQAFHVVAPSLPGYGFSSAPKEPGFGVNQMAKTFDELMVALGYTSYVAQGAQSDEQGTADSHSNLGVQGFIWPRLDLLCPCFAMQPHLLKA